MSLVSTLNLETKIKEIVSESCKLKDKFTDAFDIPINYACIFTQSQEEFDSYMSATLNIGSIIESTPSGPLFKITPIETVAGPLQLLKIRQFDHEHLDMGDADFTVSDYQQFKEKYLNKPGFSIIQKPNFEMIELMASGYSARAYFSNPPLDKQLGLI